ncbi:YciI family protein [Haloechinothrix salitolerans]|uniref:YciI family protein n=1 Tax=Haloechinothrix salitolerans TaxID=926830 RepID=A0ABW2BXY0_9PSEU
MLMVHSALSDFETRDTDPAEMQETFDFMMKLNTELQESGELLDAAGLADPRHAVTVRRRGGSAVATDGPFAEAKEVLGGYWVLDVASKERAMEIASDIVENCGAHGPDSIEVREAMS